MIAPASVLAYVLDARNRPQPVPVLVAAWYLERSPRRFLAFTQCGRVAVSTVFLAFDHGHGQTRQPVLFETLVMGGPSDGFGRRYALYAAALRGHAEICQDLFGWRADRVRTKRGRTVSRLGKYSRLAGSGRGLPKFRKPYSRGYSKAQRP